MIAVIDYGVGNLFSLKSSFDYVGLNTQITRDSEIIKNSSAVILPGVGAFRDAVMKLEELNLKKLLINEAQSGKMFLGICLGMQMLFDKSFEYGEYEGLGLIKGNIRPMKEKIKNTKLKIPHMGWNRLIFNNQDPILKYIDEKSYVYYVHSYYADMNNEDIISYSDYEINIPGIVRNGNVYGIQFHPEKSSDTGLNILKAFGEMIK